VDFVRRRTDRWAPGGLQRQLDALQAKPTDQGLVLTLGDVLFTSGRADLRPGATGNLNKLVAFLDKYPDRSQQ
jgi:outer membrane protein OmpA-like peptidoglycan-associated protein